MTVAELKQKIQDLPDDMRVLIPGNAMEGFTGEFFSPCIQETDAHEMGLEDLDEDEIKERKLLGNPPKTEKSFILVPCGFFQEHEGPHPTMN